MISLNGMLIIYLCVYTIDIAICWDLWYFIWHRKCRIAVLFGIFLFFSFILRFMAYTKFVWLNKTGCMTIFFVYFCLFSPIWNRKFRFLGKIWETKITFSSNNPIINIMYIVYKLYGDLFQAVPINLLYIIPNIPFRLNSLNHLNLTFCMVQIDFRNEMKKKMH